MKDYFRPKSLVVFHEPWPDPIKERSARRCISEKPHLRAEWESYNETGINSRENKYDDWVRDKLEEKEADAVINMEWKKKEEIENFGLEDFAGLWTVDMYVHYNQEDSRLDKVLKRCWRRSAQTLLPARTALIGDRSHPVYPIQVDVETVATEDQMNELSDHGFKTTGMEPYELARRIARTMQNNYKLPPERRYGWRG